MGLLQWLARKQPKRKPKLVQHGLDQCFEEIYVSAQSTERLGLAVRAKSEQGEQALASVSRSIGTRCGGLLLLAAVQQQQEIRASAVPGTTRQTGGTSKSVDSPCGSRTCNAVV